MKRIPKATWAEIRTAYASGIGLREIARNMGIPAGTVLAHAKREGWTRQIRAARAIVPVNQNRPAASPLEAVAATMRERGERHLGRMAGIVERGVGHVVSMDGADILEAVEDIDRLDRIGRRTYGLDDSHGENVFVPIQINIECG